PRLRASRGRQGVRGPGAGAPADHAGGDLEHRHHRRRGGHRAAEQGAGPGEHPVMIQPEMLRGGDNRVVRWFAARRNQGLLGWRGTDALVRSAICGLGLVGVGLALHQPALLLLGTPLLASAVLGAVAPGKPKVTILARPRAVEEGRSDLLTAVIEPGA